MSQQKFIFFLLDKLENKTIRLIGFAIILCVFFCNFDWIFIFVLNKKNFLFNFSFFIFGYRGI